MPWSTSCDRPRLMAVGCTPDTVAAPRADILNAHVL
jgi:hypothetical protein